MSAFVQPPLSSGLNVETGAVLSTVIIMPAPGVLMLPALSVARERTVTAPLGSNAVSRPYVHDAVPTATTHDAPPLTETSTLLTPDTESEAVPLTVTIPGLEHGAA